MGKQGTTTTADYIDFDRVMNVASKLIKEPKTKLIGTYLIIAVNTGLRSGDVLQLTYEDLQGDKLTITEQKTNKNKIIALNDAIKAIIPASASGSPFITNKGTIITNQHLNRLLKDVFAKESKTLNISSHSIRKSFGVRVYNNNGQSENALVYLSELYNHTSLAVTRIYLGIRQEERNNIYLNL